jgi:hypothetical protein
MEWRRVILVHTWYTKKIGPQLIELTDEIWCGEGDLNPEALLKTSKLLILQRPT